MASEDCDAQSVRFKLGG